MDTERRIQTICLLILTAIGVGASLYFLSPVLIPFVIALFLVYCLVPIIDLQMRFLRIRRTVALITTALLGSIVLLLMWVVIWASVQEISGSAGEYEARMNQMLDDLVTWLPKERIGMEPEELQSILRIPQETTRYLLGQFVSSIMSVLSNGLLVLVFVMFMLVGKHAPPPRAGILLELETQIKTYVATKVLISAATGALVGLVLKLLGVPFALAFGMMAFLLNFIPSIGSVIATLLPLPVVVLHPELGTFAKVMAFLIPAVLQLAIGSVLEPRIMGRSLNLHPVVVILGLIFFGMIWGIVGMFLATPIVALVKIILERMEVTRPLAEMLAGRPVILNGKSQT